MWHAGAVQNDLEGKAAVVIGAGDDEHRGVCLALAQAGALIAVAGATPELSDEARLHSIANEVWALNRPACVVTLDASDSGSVSAGVEQALSELRAAQAVIVRVGAA